jgi:hypothetical protein
MPTKERTPAQETPAEGLLLRGTCRARTRRAVVTKDGQTKYILTLIVSADGERWSAETWSALPHPAGLPAPGEACELPVRVRLFVTGGTPRYRLAFGEVDRDEAF